MSGSEAVVFWRAFIERLQTDSKSTLACYRLRGVTVAGSPFRDQARCARFAAAAIEWRISVDHAHPRPHFARADNGFHRALDNLVFSPAACEGIIGEIRERQIVGGRINHAAVRHASIAEGGRLRRPRDAAGQQE